MNGSRRKRSLLGQQTEGRGSAPPAEPSPRPEPVDPVSPPEAPEPIASEPPAPPEPAPPDPDSVPDESPTAVSRTGTLDSNAEIIVQFFTPEPALHTPPPEPTTPPEVDLPPPPPLRLTALLPVAVGMAAVFLLLVLAALALGLAKPDAPATPGFFVSE